MTRPVRQTLSVLLAALVVVLAAGCNSDPTPRPSATTSATSNPSTKSPTPTPTPSPEGAVALKAEEVVRSYLHAQTSCLTDPANTEVTCFDPVAIGTELVNLKNALTGAKAMETRVVGEIAIASIAPRGVELNSDPAASPPVVPTVIFGVCADLSDYNAVDKAGKSIVPPDRAAVIPLEVSVYNYEYPDQTKWRVGYVVPAKDLACGG